MQKHNTVESLKYQYDILQAKYASLKLAQTVSRMGSWEVDLKTKKVNWSEQTYRIYKQDQKKYFPTLDNFFDKVVKKDVQRAKALLQQLPDKQIHEIKLQVKRDDGVLIDILLNAQMIFNENNIPTKIIGTTFDTTEFTQIKIKQQQQYEILEQIHDSVISVDLNDIITYCNHGATLMHGYSKNELIGKSVYMLYPSDELQKAKKINQDALQAQFCKHEIRKKTKSGKIIYVEISFSLLKDEDGCIIGTTRYSQDITKRKAIEEKLKLQTKQLNFQAFHDSLTMLPNRALFYDRLEQSIKEVERNHQACGLLFIDLDKFKQINDDLGHHIGDEVLKEVAKRLRRCIRKQDTLARLGGDEFVIILQNIKDSNAIAKIAQKIINTIYEIIIIDNMSLSISSSIGISLLPQDSTDKDDLIKYADRAMYCAKKNGSNNYRFYTSSISSTASSKSS